MRFKLRLIELSRRQWSGNRSAPSQPNGERVSDCSYYCVAKSCPSDCAQDEAKRAAPLLSLLNGNRNWISESVASNWTWARVALIRAGGRPSSRAQLRSHSRPSPRCELILASACPSLGAALTIHHDANSAPTNDERARDRWFARNTNRNEHEMGEPWANRQSDK